METVFRIPYNEILGLAAGVFSACGIPERDAKMLSDSLVRADMRGVKSHGLVRVPSYVQQIRDGVFSAETPLEMISERGFATVLDLSLIHI